MYEPYNDKCYNLGGACSAEPLIDSVYGLDSISLDGIDRGIVVNRPARKDTNSEPRNAPTVQLLQARGLVSAVPNESRRALR